MSEYKIDREYQTRVMNAVLKAVIDQSKVKDAGGHDVVVVRSGEVVEACVMAIAYFSQGSKAYETRQGRRAFYEWIINRLKSLTAEIERGTGDGTLRRPFHVMPERKEMQ